jgi:hypothetical protein
MTDKKLTPIFTIEFAGDGEFRKRRTEFYLLPAHSHFPGFGGSRSGLVTGKTPSLITREIDAGQRDVEWDIDDPRPWDIVKRAINGEFKATAK